MPQEQPPRNEPTDAPGATQQPADPTADLTQHEVPPAPEVRADEEEDAVGGLLPFPVVAIGASKGGIEAYVELFRNLPTDTGMSFIVLPHLSADHESDLTAILAAHCAMAVRKIAHGTRPEPNTVHVLPAGQQATIERGGFQLRQRPANERAPMPIDEFFRALASDQKNRAVAVILSGADSDGALGLKAVKGEGGIAIVQDPETAAAQDMPRAGILADHVDVILPPAEIATELSRIASQFFQPSLQLLEEGNLAPADEPHFSRLLMLLRSINGVEFRNYKPATLRRRTVRRMILRRTHSLPEYVRLLQDNREELRNLHEDLLINVTRFFRDPTVYEALKADILPTLFDNRPPDQQVRIWVAGCSTGEEAYSVAICLLEYLAAQPHEPPIQIFGTDASDRSIEKARMGLYPESIAKEISPERLRRFFVRTDKGYQVSKRVRDLCIFARQNLCNDPPFSRLDLITCRNVLIYFEREMQGRIIGTFHYALRPSGCLLLGRSESVTETAGLFAALDRRNKFYAKQPAVGSGTSRFLHPPATYQAVSSGLPVPMPLRNMRIELDLQRAADRVVIARHGPPGVVINERMEVLEVRGRPAPFLAIAPGAASLHLLRMAHGDIMPTLRDAVRKAVETGGPVIEDIVVHQENHARSATLEVLPIEIGSASAGHYLVLFAQAHSSDRRLAAHSEPAVQSGANEESADVQFARMRHDLINTRLYLQSLIEERDARNQELTAAYEEIQSSNEELQSTNEELETAKEELQSTNEELQTVNDELRNRNLALQHASNDLSNLLNSVNIPVVMLGSDLTIRQFTPPAERLMRLRAADVGRPISEIRLNLLVDDIEPLLHEVLETLAMKEIEVQDRTGRWHLLRLRPYRTAENRIDGVVFLLLDIHQMRRSQEALQQTRNFAQTVVEAVQVPVVVLDAELRVRTANAAFRALAALGTPDIEKHSFPELLTMLWDWPDLRERLYRLVEQPGTAELNLEHASTRTTTRYFRLVARGVLTGSEPAVLIVLDDITAQKEAERLLESDRERLAGQVRSTAEVLGRTRGELRALAGRLFTSQEEERRRIARELHDDVSQKLAMLEIDIERLRQELPADAASVEEELTALRRRTSALSSEVRTLSHQLHPSILDHFGLAAALKNLVEEFAQREGMVATFRSASVPERLPPDVTTALYRVAQEALRNVAKHAGRTHVKVVLEGSEDAIKLSVRDFGEGFDLEGNARRGLGLVSMEERARLVGGSLSMVSELGDGTSICVTVPLAPESNA
jgi:two-component system, chemotaxis family, CheB/CheR fusion protein